MGGGAGQRPRHVRSPSCPPQESAALACQLTDGVLEIQGTGTIHASRTAQQRGAHIVCRCSRARGLRVHGVICRHIRLGTDSPRPAPAGASTVDSVLRRVSVPSLLYALAALAALLRCMTP